MISFNYLITFNIDNKRNIKLSEIKKIIVKN